MSIPNSLKKGRLYAAPRILLRVEYKKNAPGKPDAAYYARCLLKNRQTYSSMVMASTGQLS